MVLMSHCVNKYTAGFRSPLGGVALKTSPDPSTKKGEEQENCQITETLQILPLTTFALLEIEAY